MADNLSSFEASLVVKKVHRREAAKQLLNDERTLLVLPAFMVCPVGGVVVAHCGQELQAWLRAGRVTPFILLALTGAMLLIALEAVVRRWRFNDLANLVALYAEP